MRDKYFLAWGRDADENGPERDDTIGKIVSIKSCFVELEILSVNGHDIEQQCTIRQCRPGGSAHSQSLSRK
jgi:hypothetical protein